MLTRFFRPGINAALLVGAGALLVGAGVSSVRAHFEAKHAREALCAAKVQTVVARNPLLAKGWLMSPDACRNLAGLVGETGR